MKAFFQRPRKTTNNGLKTSRAHPGFHPPLLPLSVCQRSARNLLEEEKPRAAEQALHEFGADESFISLAPSGAAGSEMSLATAVTAASHIIPYHSPPCSPNRALTMNCLDADQSA